MTENVETRVQYFTVSNDGQMFSGGSSVPLHFGRSGGTLIVRGMEDDILLLSSDGETVDEVDELNFMLPAGCSVELGEGDGMHGFSAQGNTALKIKATSIKRAANVMVAG